MSAPSISPDVTTNTTCDGLTFNDTTVYTGTDITTAQVTSATIRLAYSSLDTAIQYVFTISSNVVTAVTLAVSSNEPVDISSYIGDTISDAFPFVDFDLSGDYGVTIPAVEDGVYYTTYRVQGNNGSPFSYTGTQQVLISCAACCCVAGLFANLDANCGCSDKAWMKAMRAQAYLNASRFATDVGDVDNAVAALNLATGICDGNCGCS